MFPTLQMGKVCSDKGEEFTHEPGQAELGVEAGASSGLVLHCPGWVGLPLRGEGGPPWEELDTRASRAQYGNCPSALTAPGSGWRWPQPHSEGESLRLGCGDARPGPRGSLGEQPGPGVRTPAQNFLPSGPEGSFLSLSNLAGSARAVEPDFGGRSSNLPKTDSPTIPGGLHTCRLTRAGVRPHRGLHRPMRRCSRAARRPSAGHGPSPSLCDRRNSLHPPSLGTRKAER